MTALVLTDTTRCPGAVPSSCQIQDHRLLNTKWFFLLCVQARKKNGRNRYQKCSQRTQEAERVPRESPRPTRTLKTNRDKQRQTERAREEGFGKRAGQDPQRSQQAGRVYPCFSLPQKERCCACCVEVSDATAECLLLLRSGSCVPFLR